MSTFIYSSIIYTRSRYYNCLFCCAIFIKDKSVAVNSVKSYHNYLEDRTLQWLIVLGRYLGHNSGLLHYYI